MVKIKVDMENREKLKRLHTATHIINYSARTVLGSHVWQNGSSLKPEEGSLDITHYENLSQDDIMKIERLANKLVFNNKQVKIEEIDRTEAERKYGFILYQGGAVPLKTLRVVSIEDKDVEACGGLHMETTGGIGLIRITETSKIQDGVVRLKFVVNEFALDVIDNKQNILSNIAKTFNVDEKKIEEVAEKFFKEWKSERKENEKLKELLIENYIQTAKETSELSLKEDFDMKFLMDFFNKILENKTSFKLRTPGFMLATSDVSVSEFKKEIKKDKFSLYIL